ncbi:unnamed protein product [Aphanomyces euteiches]|uniref:RxLR effector protein n=1 Tax=Aphanomyces euteiches TaxID=100861 RepID=A0A6G0W924_9STRA|nr:hypothetical protein Ae201684_017452 [Aphanomyces euteiches]KAH9085792.1 hypothetical protein Ae201684P_005493 [Aphanomyces euteiches]KAH9099006.1 hypothetical protein LEN26_016425 [Aphanomyces euteiches]KAH9123952.1 hypothetical protein AeMF1_005211 [Aphanomyces euteiches]KAH9151190.1 hypothetical protein AeRB84_006145 [Aphanomyces euteiches]
MRSTSLFIVCLALFSALFVSANHHSQHQYNNRAVGFGNQGQVAGDDQFQAETLVYTPKGKNERPVVVELAQPPRLGATRQSFKSVMKKIGNGIKKGFQVIGRIGKGLLGFRRLDADEE